MASPASEVDGARRVSNRLLSCDYCGRVPPMLYLPIHKTGVFCRACIDDVLNPPVVVVTPSARDELGDGGFIEVVRKLDEYLKQFPPERHFCGTGERRRGRPRKDAVLE